MDFETFNVLAVILQTCGESEVGVGRKRSGQFGAYAAYAGMERTDSDSRVRKSLKMQDATASDTLMC